MAILTHTFPSWLSPSFLETYYLTTLLHDIGTTETNLTSTLLSFEFYGGFITHTLLSSHSAPVPQTESVVESIIRHQDLGSVGKLSKMGAIIQLATIFDNMGENPELVSKGTIENVVKEWPRLGWSGCFAATIRRENELKPWAHTTHLGEDAFPEGVEGNELMKPYDQTGV
jgi:cyanamide hydratase